MSKYPELEEAVEKMRSEGLADDLIKNEVFKSGYSEEDFKEVLFDIKIKLIKYFSIGLATYIILIICAYAYLSSLSNNASCSSSMGWGCILDYIISFYAISVLFLSIIIYSLFILIKRDVLKAWMYFIVSIVISLFLSPIVSFLLSLIFSPNK